MPPGGFLVNVARGGIVDRDSIVSSIKSGHTAGFATDVFWRGPGLSHMPMKNLERCNFPTFLTWIDSAQSHSTAMIQTRVELLLSKGFAMRGTISS